jgi:hypothetical protein
MFQRKNKKSKFFNDSDSSSEDEEVVEKIRDALDIER